MPMIDVSPCLTDPYLMDTFQVVRRSETVDPYGEAVLTPAPAVNSFGVVYWATPADLRRLPDNQIADKAITCITRYALRSASQVGGQVYQPDLIVWHGNNFVVVHVEDYSAYGPGFIFAIATMMDITANAPVTQ